jgi:hypothetical protein
MAGFGTVFVSNYSSFLSRLEVVASMVLLFYILALMPAIC